MNWKLIRSYWLVYTLFLASLICSLVFRYHVPAALIFLVGWNWKIAKDIELLTSYLQELIDMPSCTVSFMAPVDTHNRCGKE